MLKRARNDEEIMNDWKERLGVVYSTDANYEYRTEQSVEVATVAPARQQLRVYIERKGRGGKIATIIKGFVGSEADLEALGRDLKQRCGVGGTAKEGEIIIQGDLRMRIVELLLKMGYKNSK